MDIVGITMLSKKITSVDSMAEDFRELFNTPEAKIKGVVYFFMSVEPISRVRGESNILYIGKTKQSISARYSRYAEKLASNRSGRFYRYIIENHGGIKMGCIKSNMPRETENEYFNRYYEEHLEFPPKSKVG